jgi:hypothetical protein
MSKQPDTTWPDGTPKSKNNAFNWRAFTANRSPAEMPKPQHKIITRESKATRLMPTQISFYMKARPPK